MRALENQRFFLAESDEYDTDLSRFLNPDDTEREPLEEEGINSNYMIAISLTPDFMIMEDRQSTMELVSQFMAHLIVEGGIDPSTVNVQIDEQYNEVDIIGDQEQDYEGMVEIHDILSNLMETAPAKGYVYAVYTHPVLGLDFFPMNYGYPSGRQKMMARMFGAENMEVFEAPLPPICKICSLSEAGPHQLDPTGETGICIICAFNKKMKLGAEESGKTCITCGITHEGKSKYCCKLCNTAANSRLSGRTYMRQFLAICKVLKRNPNQWLSSKEIQSGLYDTLKGQTPNVSVISQIIKIAANPDIIETRFKKSNQYRMVSGDCAKDWLKPNYYDKIMPAPPLVKEATVAIPPTETIIERVMAIQKAMDVAEAHDRALEVQLLVKYGILSKDDVVRMLFESEDDESPKQSNATPLSESMEESKRRYNCTICNNSGHNKRNCPTLADPNTQIDDYRDISGFEKWPYGGGESKLMVGGRIKRNIRSILAANPRGLSPEQLKSIYQHNTGTNSKVRSEVGKVTRIAGSMKDVLNWNGSYYLLGDGGKQEFFKTGPGSLQG